jgi:hypothetical protein
LHPNERMNPVEECGHEVWDAGRSILELGYSKTGEACHG